jgi:Mrp family chromosome partitioning ATPase
MLATGVVLAVLFGLVGFMSAGPTYRSEATIRIAPRLTPVLAPIEETGQLPHYQSFLNTQVQYIRSRNVLEHAAKNESLRSLDWAQDRNLVRALEQGLEVSSDRRSELIFVAFLARDPHVAQVACDAVVDAYDEIYGKAGGNETSQTLTRLRELKHGLVEELRTVRADIQMILAKHQTTDLRELQSMNAERIDAYERRLAAAQRAIAIADAGQSSAPEEGAEPTARPQLKDLEQINPRLAELRRKRDTARTAYEIAKETYRPQSRQYENAKSWLETVERLFEEEYERTLARWEDVGGQIVSDEGLSSYFSGLTPARLKREIITLKRQLAEMRQENEQLIGDLQLLADREYEAERLQTDLDAAMQRIQRLEVESESIATRISVVQEATWPHSVYSDGRRKRVAAGLAFGFCASFGMFFLLGTIDRRTYGAGQLNGTSAAKTPPCLGVLPDLGRSLGSHETSDVASHCVHQIRNQIEVLRDPSHGYVLAVSSPFQGDGKTSIVMALGWSYAAAGYRTLLVDCDLVGRALTRQINMLGRDGLKELLDRGSVDAVTYELSVDGLSALPVGMDAHIGPERLRRKELQSIFDALRERFDMIIVDTGPLLGSLESMPVSVAADSVVLSLRRGRSRTRLEEAVRRLHAAGAQCIGVILNCVGRAECNRYVSDASLAAAEEERLVRSGQMPPDEAEVVRPTPGDENALMIAMRSRSRHRGDDDEEMSLAS